MAKVSIVFRALNEENWFDHALQACHKQILDDGDDMELVLVDSGSTDDTLNIAKRHGCNIFHISKSEFTFGRSLNIGCEGATGDILVFISAHCIPSDEHWLSRLIGPLKTNQCDYVYGGQVGLPNVTRFSEDQVFAHYYPEVSNLTQDNFFCNNANSAIKTEVWEKYRFDEQVTGLEDMVLAKQVFEAGGQIGYVADASVMHIHEETLSQVQRRFYREALVMRDIMPEVHFNMFDMVRCCFAGLAHDLSAATRQKILFKELGGIFSYRIMQYLGTYRGHNEHRALSRKQKQSYYYPKPSSPERKTMKPGSESAFFFDAKVDSGQ